MRCESTRTSRKQSTERSKPLKREQAFLGPACIVIPSTYSKTMAAAQAKVQYSAIVLGATGSVGRRIVQLLIKNPLCKKMVVVTRRKTDAFADPKVSEVVVNMDRLEEEVSPHAQGVEVALAAFGVGKGSSSPPL